MNEKICVYFEFFDEVVELINNFYLRLIDINIGMLVVKNEFVEFFGMNGKCFLNSVFDVFFIIFLFDI